MEKIKVRIRELDIASGPANMGNLVLQVIETGEWVMMNGLTAHATGGKRALFTNRDEIDEAAKKFNLEVVDNPK